MFHEFQAATAAAALRPPAPVRSTARLIAQAALAVGAMGLFAAVGTPSAHAYPASSADTDADGIPDEWERSGRGPLAAGVARVGRRDLIVYTVRRGGISAASARQLMDRVRAFYAALPIANPDGSTGITLTVIEGPELPRDQWARLYSDLHADYMPVAWRGVARGYVIETPTAGGQTVSPDWAASGGPWQAIAHEIGHMVGLGHKPALQAANGVSPLWTSVMNYMYTYSLNGSADAVQFSRGAFMGLPLDETRLSERLNFPREALAFLEASPNNFRLETISPTVTGVDWNRNGRIDTALVSADINDGYSVEGKAPAATPDRTSGGPALAAAGGRLFVVYPKLSAAPETWTTTRPAGSARAALHAAMLSGDAFTTPVQISAFEADADVSATGFGSLLAAAWTNGRLPFVGLWSTSAAGVGTRLLRGVDLNERADQAIVAAGPAEGGRTALYVLAWDATTRKVRLAEVVDTASPGSGSPRYSLPQRSFTDLPGADGRPLASGGPVGAAVDTLTGHLMVVHHAPNGSGTDYLKLTELRRSGGAWVHAGERWVGGPAATASGQLAPVVTLNPTAPIAGRSQVNVYARPATDADGLAPITKYREVADASDAAGWRARMMIDVWNNTQSPPAAVRFANSDAYALRWKFDDPSPNQLVIYTQTGVLGGTLLDQDDVGFIADTGLRTGLRNVRCFYGATLGYRYELSPAEC